MIHHYITHYARDGKDYAEAWIQIDIFSKCFCLSKKRTIIERLYADKGYTFFQPLPLAEVYFICDISTVSSMK